MMKTTMWALKNSIKHYSWGSYDAITTRFHIPNPDSKQPMAEVWMGAHILGTSIAINAEGEQLPLDKLIATDPEHILGRTIYQKYHSLPYLFKILSAKDPLSIQVHPELAKAKLGYAKENQQHIPLDSPKRNYKDPNHKPELVYAITPFLAMNAFRPIREIISLFAGIPSLEANVAQLATTPNSEGLKQFFYTILTLTDEKKQKAIDELIQKAAQLKGEPFDIINEIFLVYPHDSGLFAPLILNVIELQPGQAMFLHAQTPHAYLKGTALEVMANSDNVLRAGLTPKFIDIDELFDNTQFTSIEKNNLLTQPITIQNKLDFPVPVDDFAFEIITSDMNKNSVHVASAEILLCLTGEVTIATATDSYTLTVGKSLFIAACAHTFTYQGEGTIARVCNLL